MSRVLSAVLAVAAVAQATASQGEPSRAAEARLRGGWGAGDYGTPAGGYYARRSASERRKVARRKRGG